jgi:hypothetical protein
MNKMNKKLLIFITIILIFLASPNIEAENVNFGWTLGNVWLFHDSILNRTNIDIDFLHFNWLLNEIFIIGFSIYSLNGTHPDDLISKSTLLPIELGFIPLNFNLGQYNQLGLSLNSRFGWQMLLHENIENSLYDNRFVGSIGSQIFLQFRNPGQRTPYSRYFSIFAEYNNLREFKIGVKIDLTVILLGLLWIDIINNDNIEINVGY